MTGSVGVQLMLVVVALITGAQGVKFAAEAVVGYRRERRRGRLTHTTRLWLVAVASMAALHLAASAYTVAVLVVADVPLLGGGR